MTAEPPAAPPATPPPAPGPGPPSVPDWVWTVGPTLGGGFDAFAVPAAQLAVIVGVGALAGVLAAVRPGRRAARLDILQAIATQ